MPFLHFELFSSRRRIASVVVFQDGLRQGFAFNSLLRRRSLFTDFFWAKVIFEYDISSPDAHAHFSLP